MEAEILCVGTELLLGDIVNTNAAYIARELALAGVNVYHQSVVGDNPQRLKESLSRALEQSDIVITTGGLGPTYDDLTKETVADLFGCEMELDKSSLENIKNFFSRMNRPMTENNVKQAQFPKGAIILKNSNGTAPGMIVEDKEKKKAVILLPGPPREMKPMFDEGVMPYLMKRTNTTLVSKSVHIFGMGESQVETILRKMMESCKNPTIAPYAKDGEVLLRVTACAKNKKEATAMIDPVIEQISAVLGDVIYGIDVGTLQGALVKALHEKNLKVATAESCTGGLVSKRITEISGASQVFECGVCCYANRIKEQLLHVNHETLVQYGAVSAQTAKEMAQGARRLADADIGVSVTGIAGPDGGTEEKPVGLVYVGVDSEHYSEVLELKLARGYPDERELIRYLASSNAISLALKAAKHSN